MKRAAASVPLPDLGTVASRPRLPLPVLSDDAYPAAPSKWVRGLNCPSIHRGGDGDGKCSLQAFHCISNLAENLGKLPDDKWGRWAEELALVGVSLAEFSVVGLIGALLGLPHRTVRRILPKDEASSHDMRVPGCKKPASVTLAEGRLRPRAPSPAQRARQDTATSVQGCVAAAASVRPSAVAEQLACQIPITQASRPVGGQVAPACSGDPLGVAMRVASRCTLVVSHGLPSALFSEVLDFLDAYFPGSFGNLFHSERFVAGFRKSLLRTHRLAQTRTLHAAGPGLRSPSDFFRTFDTLTPKCGDPLLVHVDVITDPATGLLMPLLVGLSPLTLDVTSKKPAPAPAVGDEEDLACLQIPGGKMPTLVG